MNDKEKLEKILSCPRLKKSSIPFVKSLFSQKTLSEKQLLYVENFWNECFPPEEVIMNEKKWVDSFCDSKKIITKIIGEYFRYNYKHSQFGVITENPDFIPSEKQYNRYCESQLSVKILENYNSEPLFKIGDICSLRDTSRNRSCNNKYYSVGSSLLILEMNKDIKNDYKVFYLAANLEKMEDHFKFLVREDYLKKIKLK